MPFSSLLLYLITMIKKQKQKQKHTLLLDLNLTLHLVITVIFFFFFFLAQLLTEKANTQSLIKDEFWNVNLYLNYMFWSQ